MHIRKNPKLTLAKRQMLVYSSWLVFRGDYEMAKIVVYRDI